MGWELFPGDVLQVLRRFPAHSFDGCLTDPPYALEFMGKAWDKALPGPDVWAEVQRVLKPGAYLLAFGGTRTFHRLACNIEDGGFLIRDSLSWLHGQGFPKGKTLPDGYNTQLKPAWENPVKSHLAPGAVMDYGGLARRSRKS